MTDLGPPSSYELLEAHTPVYASDGEEIGRVERVLALPDEDIFHGVVISTGHGDRFVDAETVRSIHERGVILSVDHAATASFPEPTAGPAAMSLDTTDVTESTAAERAHRIWDVISGKW